MKHANLAVAVMVIASLAVPTAYAKPKKKPAPPQPASTSQAGGLPATNARLDELEREIRFLQADLAALSMQLAVTPTVFVAAGSRQITSGSPVTLAAMDVRPGTYLIMAAVRMKNSPGNAKAKCVMWANGTPLAGTSDLLFPLLSTGTSGATDSTIFAPLQGTFSSTTGPIAIRVECSEGNGGAAYDADVNIAALKVATVNPPLPQPQ